LIPQIDKGSAYGTLNQISFSIFCLLFVLPFIFFLEDGFHQSELNPIVLTMLGIVAGVFLVILLVNILEYFYQILESLFSSVIIAGPNGHKNSYNSIKRKIRGFWSSKEKVLK